jgi:hypothetical protein
LKHTHKKKKKKQKLNKPTTRRPTRPTRRPSSTTWFPLTFTSTSTAAPDYFTRPVVHDRPEKGDIIAEPLEGILQSEHDDISSEDNVLKDALLNSIFPNRIEEKVTIVKEDVQKRLPTLTEVAGLFDDFYSYAVYYPWKLEADTVKQMFIRVLEDFAKNTFDNKRQLMKFLQKKVYVYSRIRSKESLSLDPDLYKRYDFIVTDLAERRIKLVKQNDELTTKPPRKPIRSKRPQISHKNMLILNNRVINQSKEKGNDNIKLNDDDTGQTKKPVGLIQNFFGQQRPSIKLASLEQLKQAPGAQYYPQTSGWSGGPEPLSLRPMFGPRPPGPPGHLAGILGAAGETGTGTGCLCSPH